MKWDAYRFCVENGVTCWLEGKNVRPGWVHVQCPLCGDHSNHGGFNPEDGSYACWRCKGSHPVVIIQRLLQLNHDSAAQLYDKYKGSESIKKHELPTKSWGNPAVTLVEPPGIELSRRHRNYLSGRGFDPDELIRMYDLTGTGPFDCWKGVDFKLRVIIPIRDFNGAIVNFQGRDITEKQDLRYKGPPIDMVPIHHKHLLYGGHLALSSSTVVVVEGVMDMWKMGPGYVATFGTSLHIHQIIALSHWKNIIFLFDPEPEAQKRAAEYARDLGSLGCHVDVLSADFGTNAKGDARDCGDLTPQEVDELKAYINVNFILR